jgi:hypothetical protein
MEHATTTPADTADQAWDNGWRDGERAALDGLSEDTARDRAEEADRFRPMYAAGYWEAYLSTTATQAARNTDHQDTP